ncbi:MAG: PHP domain-containing protein, partial [Bacillota bacterium]|nr:PHP domain-containing protein [Bacillota bacterium]
MKRINEIFSDYESRGNINTAIVESVVLSKKTKTLELKLSSDKYIDISEFDYLNKFIRKRFALEDSIIAVKYAEGTDKKPIEQEIENIVFFVAEKYPALKAVLNNSEYEVVDNAISFNFKVAVSGFLKSMDYDKKIHNAIKNLYGTGYKINFVDKVSGEELLRIAQAKPASGMPVIPKEVKAAPVNNYPQQPRDAAIVKPDGKAEADGKKGDSSLILGRNAKIKEPVIKITDITPDEGRIAIEGEISNIEAKELKSGKTLVSFDLYDGSSSMTCKAFLKPGEDGEVLSRLKGAKGIRIAGNAGYSKFSGEVEMIANTIVETEGVKKIKRMDRAEVKRVELHMHSQMSQMDAMTSATDLIKRAMSWGMTSIALTDHGVVQAFPEAHKLLG